MRAVRLPSALKSTVYLAGSSGTSVVPSPLWNLTSRQDVPPTPRAAPVEGLGARPAQAAKSRIVPGSSTAARDAILRIRPPGALARYSAPSIHLRPVVQEMVPSPLGRPLLCKTPGGDPRGIVSRMARLKPKKRARLPDRAFAYIDSRGRRRLPIHDKAHVRNALARFNQVEFESDAAREQARKRLLNAAKKYRIVPVGFIIRQLQSERKYATARIQATATEAAALPIGFVTLLMSDIEGSTVLLRKLGDRYGALLNDIRGILRAAVSGSGGREIDARADEFFAVVERAGAAVEAAVGVQRDLAARQWT